MKQFRDPQDWVLMITRETITKRERSAKGYSLETRPSAKRCSRNGLWRPKTPNERDKIQNELLYTYLWRGFHLRPHRDDSVAFRGHRRKRSASSVCLLRLIKKLFPNPQSSREGGCAHKKVNAVVVLRVFWSLF